MLKTTIAINTYIIFFAISAKFSCHYANLQQFSLKYVIHLKSKFTGKFFDSKFGLYYKLVYLCIMISKERHRAGLLFSFSNYGLYCKPIKKQTKLLIMEDKKLTPTESMDLIASMISNTKRHLTKGEGNMLLFWGYLCTAVAVTTLVLNILKHIYGIDIPLSLEKWAWWLIPLIGIPYTLVATKRAKASRTVLTYSDRLSASLWNYVLWLALGAFIIGFIFLVSGFNVWYIMELFAFFVVGMSTSIQGMIIRERSLVLGGAFSVICGGFLVASIISGNHMFATYSVPLFIVDFIVMMIIPGHILNHKASKEK